MHITSRSMQSFSRMVSAGMGVVILLSLLLATAVLGAPTAVAQEAGTGILTPDGEAPTQNWRDVLEEHVASADDSTADQTADRGTTTIVLYLRFQPNYDATVLAVMPAGAVVDINGPAESGFLPVIYDGVSGYAAEAYVSTDGSAPAPVATEPAPVAPSAGTDIVSIIYAAAAAYGQSGDDMLRVATCESGLNPYAYNPAGWYGLYQFTLGTWASTPYGAYDIYDPVAQANAAAWMWSVGRRGEWTCQ